MLHLILQSILDLLDGGKNWCKGHMALNKDDKIMFPWEDGACKWCLLGAAMKLAEGQHHDDTIQILRVVMDVRVASKIAHNQDTVEWPQVEQWLKEAIWLAKKIDTLRAAKALLMKGWCQGSFGRTKQGVAVFSCDTAACEWCFSGALCRAANDLHLHHSIEMVVRKDLETTFKMHYGLAVWNDLTGRTKEEVLAVCDSQINLYFGRNT